jgi:hypothetical protein
MQVRTINLWNYQLVPRLCSPDICAVFVAPKPEITVLIMSGTRLSCAVCLDDGHIVGWLCSRSVKGSSKPVPWGHQFDSIHPRCAL